MGNLEKLLVVGVLTVVIAILTVSLFWTNDIGTMQDYGELAPESSESMDLAVGTPEQNLSAQNHDPMPLEGVPMTMPTEDAVTTTVANNLDGTANNLMSPAQSTTPAVDVSAEPLFTDTAHDSYVRYKIKPGDTLELIASRELGSKLLVGEIQKANEGLDPRRLSIGRVILLPKDLIQVSAKTTTTSQAMEKQPSLVKMQPLQVNAGNAVNAATPSSESYTVKSGDTLWKIAEKFYQDGTKWKKIVDANSDKLTNPNDLKVGQKLQIP